MPAKNASGFKICGNMDGVLAMAKVTTIAKYRPIFRRLALVQRVKKYRKLWSKMPSTDSLRRAWNEELDKVSISRITSDIQDAKRTRTGLDLRRRGTGALFSKRDTWTK